MSGAAICPANPPPRPQPSSAAASSLAPGFRFHPTDEELVSYYLKRKIFGRPLRVDAIAEVDLYRCEPWDLPGFSRIRSRDREWYFFSPLDRKYSNRSRTNRATDQGYWKTTGKDRQVLHGSRVVGMKKTLVFHVGRAPHGKRSNWVMHEYRLEDKQHPEIPQDAYVVCRIFEKNGAGPQNGAQYGAPFVEEEWEDDVDGSVMLPVSGVDGLNNAGEAAYLEYKDFTPSQDLGNQDVSPLSVMNSDGNDSGGQPEDANSLREHMLEHQTTMPGYNDGSEPGVWSVQNFTDCVGEKTDVKDVVVYPVQTDEYVELMDLADIKNGCSISRDGPVSASLRTAALNGASESSYLQKVPDVDEFFDTSSEHPGQLELLPAYSLEDNFYQQTDDYGYSGQQIQNIPLKDEPDVDFGLTQDSFIPVDELLDSSLTHPYDFAMVDDLMAYFDATEGDLQNGPVDFPEAAESLNSSSLLGQPKFSDKVNGVLDGASSSAGSIAERQYKDKFEMAPGISAPPEKADSTITKRLVSMLGSISAPPACAAEFMPAPGKSVSQASVGQTSGTIHVTAGMIRISGLTVSSNALPKKGDLDILLAYGITDNIVVVSKPLGLEEEPITKMQGAAASLVLRGGFYLFFLSALILCLSYKVGVYIHGR